MNETVLVAALSLIGTLIGSFAGIVTANKLVNYRLQQLEQKVQAHNNLVERTYHLESEMELLHQQIKHMEEAI